MLSHPVPELKPPLLQTKISVPLLPAEFVHRHRLTERIGQGVKGLLTLISAPAGFGKTNLLIEWAAETKSPIAWLTIDEEDNDPSRFLSYLIGAIQAVNPGLGEEALDFIQSTKGRGLETGVTLLLNEISVLRKNLILALDEFQVLESETIIQGFNYLLKHCPRNLHLIIATRKEPAFDLASLRVKGRVVELGADELRFNHEEIDMFLHEVTGMQFSPGTIDALEQNTDGWITGLQMAAISMRHRADSAGLPFHLQGDSHYLVDFLAKEVLDRQPEEIRQFLLKSSVLDQFNGSLCEAVINPESQPGYGAVMLDQLEHANLFIVALDEKHEWFRYHHLFGDFLRHVLAESHPAEISLMKKRAALWLETQSNLEEAIKYALDAGDDEWTADLIERNVETMIKTGEIFSLTHWIGALPNEIIQQHPRISLTYAWGLITSYQLDTANYWLDALQQKLDHDKKMTGKDQEEAGLWNMYGGLAVCRSTLAILNGDAEQAAQFSTEAANYLQQENPFIGSLLSLENSWYFIVAGDTSKAIESLRKTVRIARQANNLLVMIVATCQLAQMQALQGQLSKALVTLQKVQFMASKPDGSIHPLAGIADLGFGEILLERDVLDKAEEYLARGWRVAKSLWSISSLDSMVSLARLLQIKGDTSGSQLIIEEASQMALGTESSQWDDAMVSAIAARLALQRNDLPAATQWWKKGHFPGFMEKIPLEDYPYHIFEYLQLTQVRCLLATSREAADRRQLQWALELLEPLLRTAKRFKRVTSQIEILLLQSLAQNNLGNVDRATEILLSALALGEPEDYRRIFLDEGQLLAHILTRCQTIQQDAIGVLPSYGYIESLLDALQPNKQADQIHPRIARQPIQPAITQTGSGLALSLSAREMEVLSLIAEGKSNQEISAQLYLALNTVKRHAYNIYTKLEVKKRTQAVSRARQLGLIP
jgi:LuxR family maltose regulon positive regulatory protein